MQITDLENTEISGREQAIQFLAEFLSLGSAEENEVFDDEDDCSLFLEAASVFAFYWSIPFDKDLAHQTLLVNMKEYYGDAWSA